jgi:hypothetical protein
MGISSQIYPSPLTCTTSTLPIRTTLRKVFSKARSSFRFVLLRQLDSKLTYVLGLQGRIHVPFLSKRCRRRRRRCRCHQQQPTGQEVSVRNQGQKTRGTDHPTGKSHSSLDRIHRMSSKLSCLVKFIIRFHYILAGAIRTFFRYLMAVHGWRLRLRTVLADHRGLLRKGPWSRSAPQGGKTSRMVDQVRYLPSIPTFPKRYFRKVFGRNRRGELNDVMKANMSVNALARQREQRDDAAFDSP